MIEHALNCENQTSCRCLYYNTSTSKQYQKHIHGLYCLASPLDKKNLGIHKFHMNFSFQFFCNKNNFFSKDRLLFISVLFLSVLFFGCVVFLSLRTKTCNYWKLETCPYLVKDSLDQNVDILQTATSINGRLCHELSV